jgi:hypothetical protein
MTRPRFLLAIRQGMRWTDGGVFETAREAERGQRAMVALGEGDTRIIQLRGRDPQTVLARMRRSLVIVRQGAQRKLLVGFYIAPPHPNRNLNMKRKRKSRTTGPPPIANSSEIPARRRSNDPATPNRDEDSSRG